MPSNLVVRVKDGSDALREALAQVEQELELPGEFPAEVQQAAEQAAAEPTLPELDRTDLAFLTIDPEGSMDLDQALHIERAGDGFLVHYAIADVAAFVRPGDPVDLEAHARGETLYGAGSRIPLHPPALSEGAASLLPDQVRPALLWSITLDAAGAPTDVHRRAGAGALPRADVVRRRAGRARRRLRRRGAAAAARGRTAAASSRRRPAAASRSRCPSRRSRSPRTVRSGSSSASSCRSSCGTPRSPCSPGWPPRR